MIKSNNSKTYKKKLPFFLPTIDHSIFWAAILLSIIGVIFSYSSQIQIFNETINLHYKYIKQIFYLFTGILLMWMTSYINYKKLANHSHIIYFACLALLAYTLWNGTVINNSKRWISVGGITIQPSEFIKIAMIIYIANYLDKYRLTINKFKRLFFLILSVGLPVFLILAQPDLGTALVFIPVILVMLLSIGLSLKYFISLILLTSIALFISLFLTYGQMKNSQSLLYSIISSKKYIILISSFFILLSITIFNH